VNGVSEKALASREIKHHRKMKKINKKEKEEKIE
jgi:hypothetical protein